MSLQKYVRQLKPKNESYISHVDKLQTLLERVDTTLNASVTELFPCLAFNKKFKPSSVEDFKKFLYTLNLNTVKSSFDKKDAASAKLVIEKLPTMDEKFLKDKMSNAIGITNYLFDLIKDWLPKSPSGPTAARNSSIARWPIYGRHAIGCSAATWVIRK